MCSICLHDVSTRLNAYNTKATDSEYLFNYLQHFMCSREVNLTEEEKETLKAEGLPIPTTLPLTKVQ